MSPHLPYSFVLTLVCSITVYGGLAARADAAGAKAMFLANMSAANVLDKPSLHQRSLPRTQLDVFMQTQEAWLKSQYVLSAALAKQGVSQLAPIRAAGDDAVEWLRRTLSVNRPNRGDLFELVVESRDLDADQAALLANAVAEVYMEEVVFDLHRTRLRPRDILRSCEQKLAAEIRKKTSNYYERVRESGVPGGTEKNLITAQIGRLENEVLRLENQVFQRSLPGADSPDGDDLVLAAYEKRIATLRERIGLLTDQLTGSVELDNDLQLEREAIDQLRKIQRSIAERIEQWDIEANAPMPVRRIAGVEQL